MSSQLCQEIECIESPLDPASDNPLYLYCYEHAKKHGADVSGFKSPVGEEPEEEVPAIPPQADSPHIKRPAARKTDGPIHSRHARETLAVDPEQVVHKYASLNQMGKAMGIAGSNLIKFIREGRPHRGILMYYADTAPAELRARAIAGSESLVSRERKPAPQAAPKPETPPQPAPAPAQQVAMTVSPAPASPPNPTLDIQDIFTRDHTVITARRACLQRQIRELQMEDFQLAAKQEYVEEKLALLQE